MLSLWHTHGRAPRSSYLPCRMLAHWKRSKLYRAGKRKVLRKKTAADVIPVSLLPGVLSMSAFCGQYNIPFFHNQSREPSWRDQEERRSRRSRRSKSVTTTARASLLPVLRNTYLPVVASAPRICPRWVGAPPSEYFHTSSCSSISIPESFHPWVSLPGALVPGSVRDGGSLLTSLRYCFEQPLSDCFSCCPMPRVSLDEAIFRPRYRDPPGDYLTVRALLHGLRWQSPCFHSILFSARRFRLTSSGPGPSPYPMFHSTSIGNKVLRCELSRLILATHSIWIVACNDRSHRAPCHASDRLPT